MNTISSNLFSESKFPTSQTDVRVYGIEVIDKMQAISVHLRILQTLYGYTGCTVSGVVCFTHIQVVFEV